MRKKNIIQKAINDLKDIRLLSMSISMVLTPLTITHSSLRIVRPDNVMTDVFLTPVIYVGFYVLAKKMLYFIFE
ncbi:hypothetical protein [Morganella morganii]|uniref:hypothetical protein n=1 Tax=Morganella morganii TaxID=582 RepID=UPI001A2C9183|nr:hypothetical protein [Morganella morganii]MCU6211302.1 hypothetical protein [Morganella morganii]MCU6224281.1 hypothetical protein [Morganella morganii]MCU6232899.1 hypothetical protein [Morganella morganii]MCU6238434.1 hypothetical protein [Morganella morganii]MCU6275097.1 hypothetical protein [Morganella morganii]